MDSAEAELRGGSGPAPLSSGQSGIPRRSHPGVREHRLQRAVDLKQEVYVSLAKSYDEARIAEVRDTPVITIIDSAVAPDKPSGPKPVLNGIIGFLAGGVLPSCWSSCWSSGPIPCARPRRNTATCARPGTSPAGGRRLRDGVSPHRDLR